MKGTRLLPSLRSVIPAIAPAAPSSRFSSLPAPPPSPTAGSAPPHASAFSNDVTSLYDDVSVSRPVPLPCYWSAPEPPRGSTQGPPTPELILSRVACMRNDVIVFRDVSMTVQEGGAMLLTGPNGSGKSSLLRMLAGFLRPSAGYIMWRGQDITDTDAYDLYRVHVHLVAQKDAIKDQLTVDTNVRLWAEMDGSALRVDWALERIGLANYAHEPSSILSLGQRKRLQLARLLAMPRPIWLLDEPSVGLDVQGVGILEEIITEHRRCGGIALVATHTHIDLPDCMKLKFSQR